MTQTGSTYDIKGKNYVKSNVSSDDGRLTWWGADNFCKAIGSELASISDFCTSEEMSNDTGYGYNCPSIGNTMSGFWIAPKLSEKTGYQILNGSVWRQSLGSKLFSALCKD